MTTLRAVIIDDEPKAVELLSIRLSQHCPQVELLASCTSSIQGVELIRSLRPNLVFLDIEMPGMNGFQVLNAVKEVEFALIFVTAYDQFAIRAFQYSALDYLLKPLSVKDLIRAVTRAQENRATDLIRLHHLQKQYESPSERLPERIALPYQNGVIFAQVKDILYCESNNNYTFIYLRDGMKYIVVKSLREIQEVLEERNFVRIHRQYLVNIDCIKKFVRGEGNYVVMDNGCTIPVARAQKDKLKEKVGWL